MPLERRIQRQRSLHSTHAR